MGAELRQGLVERASISACAAAKAASSSSASCVSMTPRKPKQPVERRRRYIFRPRQRGDGLHEMGEQFAVDRAVITALSRVTVRLA